MPELISALKAEKHATVPMVSGDPKPTKEQIDDILYFRDFVMPEFSRQKRTDQQSCVGCHGVRGRVPTFYLSRPISSDTSRSMSCSRTTERSREGAAW